MFKIWNNVVSGCVQPMNAGSGKISEVATLSCIPAIFLNLLNALLLLSGLTALLMFLSGTFKLLSAKGDSKKIQSVKDTFTYAVIGLIIVLFSFTIISIISRVTNIDCITKFGVDACK